MPFLTLITVCVSIIVGILGVASIFVNGWVKASHITELRAETEKKMADFKNDINQLWEKISEVKVLAAKMEAVEKGITEIKELLRDK